MPISKHGQALTEFTLIGAIIVLACLVGVSQLSSILQARFTHSQINVAGNKPLARPSSKLPLTATIATIKHPDTDPQHTNHDQDYPDYQRMTKNKQGYSDVNVAGSNGDMEFNGHHSGELEPSGNPKNKQIDPLQQSQQKPESVEGTTINYPDAHPSPAPI